MTVKLFEIRDTDTLIPAMAVQVDGDDGWLMRRAGFGDEASVYLIALATQHCSYDPYGWRWGGPRTMPVAHLYILEHFDELESGAVIDVEFILGEKPTPKVSEEGASAY